METLSDTCGKPHGIIREIAGGQERLYDRGWRPIAILSPEHELHV